MIKKRQMKPSNRGLYIQDIEVTKNTPLKPGTHYSLNIDQKNREIIIQSSPEGKRVSRRKIGEDEYKSVIDVRDKEVKDILSTSDSLQLEILGDRILVKWFKKGKVIALKDFLKYRSTAPIMMSMSDLQQAVGELTQSSFFEFTTNTNISTSLDHEISTAIEVVSMFSGAGLLDLGFVQEGFKVIKAIEYDEDATKTYKRNHDDHIVCADVRQINYDELPKAHAFLGGVPCTVFTNVNRNENCRLLDHPDYDLFRYYIKGVKSTQAEVFILENVPAMATALGGRVIEEIKSELHEYHIRMGVLNSADYGSPQLRERLIMIGCKTREIELPEKCVDIPMTVQMALDGIHDGLPNQKDIVDSKPPTIERMKHVPQGGNWRNIPEHLRTAKMGKGGTQSIVYHRLDPNKPSKTIVHPRKSLITHPTEDRTLSVRECARLFDLPDDFVFEGLKDSKFQQVANGVPVKLARAVARKVKEFFGTFLQPQCV